MVLNSLYTANLMTLTKEYAVKQSVEIASRELYTPFAVICNN